MAPCAPPPGVRACVNVVPLPFREFRSLEISLLARRGRRVIGVNRSTFSAVRLSPVLRGNRSGMARYSVRD